MANIISKSYYEYFCSEVGGVRKSQEFLCKSSEKSLKKSPVIIVHMYYRSKHSFNTFNHWHNNKALINLVGMPQVLGVVLVFMCVCMGHTNIIIIGLNNGASRRLTMKLNQSYCSKKIDLCSAHYETHWPLDLVPVNQLQTPACSVQGQIRRFRGLQPPKSF